MINGENIEKFKNKNKIYVPEDYVETNNRYTINNETLTIITDKNCTSNYNTTYCDCRDYNIKYNIITETYQCNRNTTNKLVNSQYITSDINESVKITNEYVKEYSIYLLMIIGIILIVNLFKRNSRNI